MLSTASVIELLERWSIDDFSVHRAVDDALLGTIGQREGDAERLAEFRLDETSALAFVEDSIRYAAGPEPNRRDSRHRPRK